MNNGLKHETTWEFLKNQIQQDIGKKNDNGYFRENKFLGHLIQQGGIENLKLLKQKESAKNSLYKSANDLLIKIQPLYIQERSDNESLERDYLYTLNCENCHDCS